MVAAVIELPKEIARMREADLLIKRWCEIERCDDQEERVRRFIVLRSDILDHLTQNYS